MKNHIANILFLGDASLLSIFLDIPFDRAAELCKNFRTTMTVLYKEGAGDGYNWEGFDSQIRAQRKTFVGLCIKEMARHD